MSQPSLTDSNPKYGSLALLLMIALLLSSLYLWQKAEHRAQTNAKSVFSLALANISQKIDSRVSKMKLVSKSIANDTHIHDWVDSGFAQEREDLLIEKLNIYVNEYELTSASFADKNTHKYWNHEGFLRTLQPETDNWYFDYIASDQKNLISVYHDKNKHRVDIYVNYQQPESNGLSGIATSFDSILDTLNIKHIEGSKDIFLVDSTGVVQVHHNADLPENTVLSSLIPQHIADYILGAGPTPLVYADENQFWYGASYIPSMDWYVVAVVESP